jgi:Tfp pilus assembly protein PilO
MTGLAQIKKRFFTVLGIVAIVDVILLGYLLWPGSSSAGRRAREETLQQQYRALGREVAPLKDIDGKLMQTRADISDLYSEQIPNRWSQISSHLETLVRESGVTAESIKYTSDKPEKGDLHDVQRVDIDTTVKGDYSKVARFINAMEQDKLLFIIQQISLSSQEGGTVTLAIKFNTFLKQAPSEASSGEQPKS